MRIPPSPFTKGGIGQIARLKNRKMLQPEREGSRDLTLNLDRFSEDRSDNHQCKDKFHSYLRKGRCLITMKCDDDYLMQERKQNIAQTGGRVYKGINKG